MSISRHNPPPPPRHATSVSAGPQPAAPEAAKGFFQAAKQVTNRYRDTLTYAPAAAIGAWAFMHGHPGPWYGHIGPWMVTGGIVREGIRAYNWRHHKDEEVWIKKRNRLSEPFETRQFSLSAKAGAWLLAHGAAYSFYFSNMPKPAALAMISVTGIAFGATIITRGLSEVASDYWHFWDLPRRLANKSSDGSPHGGGDSPHGPAKNRAKTGKLLNWPQGAGGTPLPAAFAALRRSLAPPRPAYAGMPADFANNL
jgi:hypothetical protein